MISKLLTRIDDGETRERKAVSVRPLQRAPFLVRGSGPCLGAEHKKETTSKVRKSKVCGGHGGTREADASLTSPAA